MDSEQFFSWRKYLTHSNLDATTKHVLLTLSTYYSEQGSGVYPSTRTLSLDCSLSERAVITHIMLGAREGWVGVKKHGFGDRRWKRNEYALMVPKGAKLRSMVSVEALNDIQQLNDEALNVVPRGTERDDNEALNDVQLNTQENTKENTPLSEAPTFPPLAGGASSSREPFYDWKTIRDAYPKHRMLPNQEREARDYWNAQRYTQAEKNAIVRALLRFVVSKGWTEHDGRYVPSPKKFLEECYWEHEAATDAPYSEHASEVRDLFLSSTGERSSLHGLTEERRKMLAERYADALSKSADKTHQQAMELLTSAIEAAAESHEKRKIPKRLTMESIFETTEKFERWLAEVYA